MYKWVRTAGVLSFIPFVLVSGPVAGYFLGDFIVKKFVLPGYLTYICITAGFIASVHETVKIIRFALLNESK
ncbi:MAG: hypothetical protein PHR91_01175 [Candidatus Omnitrophica bacterium]|nr:hypothetical protein [Candidatus Omnitrophota bacterium]